ncbi:MAG: helix-turn-helix transcriptional regulator, partial [bacterium]|nr:helix-turn-helix transcriptional regulator [bacterium]
MRKQAIGQLGQRIKGLREGLGLNQKEFARGLRLSNTYLSELEKGRSAPGYDFFFHASRHYKINPLFLLHGYEPRFIPQDEPEEEKVQDTDRER